jgi:hypothetical protein
MPSETPIPTPVATPLPTPTPRLVEVPIATPPPPTTLAEPPATTLPPEPPPEAAQALEPIALRSLTPPTVRRKGMAILDLRGSGFRADQRAVVFRGKEIPTTITVVRQRFVNPGLMQVGLQVDEAAATGAYAIGLADPQGRVSNTLRFEVAK